MSLVARFERKQPAAGARVRREVWLVLVLAVVVAVVWVSLEQVALPSLGSIRWSKLLGGIAGVALAAVGACAATLLEGRDWRGRRLEPAPAPGKRP